MAKTYPVKWFNEKMQGAPQIDEESSGQVASLLKAVLVDGFGALVPDSIVWDSDLLLAKASFSSGHSYLVDSIIYCSGSVLDDYNGEHRVMKVSINDLWFELDSVPFESASGAIEIKVAPLGWEVEASNAEGSIVIFKPTNGIGKVSLRVDNSTFEDWSTAYSVKCNIQLVSDVVDYESFNEVAVQNAWSASSRLSSGGWDLIGDNRIFYYLPVFGKYDGRSCYVAGYIDSIKPSDEWHFAVSVDPVYSAASSSSRWDNGSHVYNQFPVNAGGYLRIARPYHQLPSDGLVDIERVGAGLYGSDVMAYPNLVDNGYYLNTQPSMIIEEGGSFRGTLPIFIQSLSFSSALHRVNLKELPEHDGKIFRMILCSKDRSVSSENTDSLIGFDISTVEV